MTISLSQKFPQFESFMVIISFKDIRKYEQSVTEWEASTLSANAPDFTDGEALLNNTTLPNTSSWLASLNNSIKSTLLQSNWVLKK